MFWHSADVSLRVGISLKTLQPDGNMITAVIQNESPNKIKLKLLMASTIKCLVYIVPNDAKWLVNVP